MKWFLISMAIWQDGSFEFIPVPNGDYATETECLKDIQVMPPHQSSSGQPDVFHGYICVTSEAWNGFVRNKISR
jgi:hypothetical protein